MQNTKRRAVRGAAVGAMLLLFACTGTTTGTIPPGTLTALNITGEVTTAAGTTAQLVATAKHEDGTTEVVTGTATWTSSDATVAKVDGGLVTALTTGTATITAAYSGVSGTHAVAVTAPALSRIEVTPATPTVAKGLSVQLVATGVYANDTKADLSATATWSAGDAAIATVSSAGLVLGVGTGSATVLATVGEVVGQVSVAVSAPTVARIEVVAAEPSAPVGATLQVSAIAVLSDATTQTAQADVTYTSSDPTVATVSNDPGTKGQVTIVGAGNVTITATLGGQTASVGIEATAAVTTSLDVTADETTLAKGTTTHVHVHARLSDGTSRDAAADVTWSSSDDAVATLSGGLLAATGEGTATLTATLGATTGTLGVTVTAAALVSLKIDQAPLSLAKGTSGALTVAGTYTDTLSHELTDEAVWSSSNEGVATVANAAGTSGNVSAKGEGDAVITAAFGGQVTTVAVHVSPAVVTSLSLAASLQSIVAGRTAQLTATAHLSDGSTEDVTGTATWESADDTVATVSGDAGSAGLVRGLKQGSVVLTGHAAGASATVTLQVTAAVLESLSVTANQASIAVGGTLTVTATGHYSDGSTPDLSAQVAWSSSDVTIATVSNDAATLGVVTGNAEGSADITAALGDASAKVTIGVVPAV